MPCNYSRLKLECSISEDEYNSDKEATDLTEGPSMQSLSKVSDDTRTLAFDKANIEQLESKMMELRFKEDIAQQKINDLNALWETRRKPLERMLQDIQYELREVESQRVAIDQAKTPRIRHTGPECLWWVCSTPFEITSSLVVLTNLLVMVLIMNGAVPEGSITDYLDDVFMVWYVFELSAKFAYFRKHLYLGAFGEVWINWVDTVIVLSGVLLQWIVPGFGIELGGNANLLIWLRLVRFLRVIKLIRILFHGDLSWVQSPTFEAVSTAVIAVNSIVMALELDHPSHSWSYVENIFLCFYLFQVLVDLRFEGPRKFFVESEDLAWHYLDSIICFGGVLDLWMIPLIKAVMAFISGSSHSGGGNERVKAVMSLLRLMRLLRILRLVKLMKAIKPLYRLMAGVVDSLKAMQWVMVLSLMVLYACAIFWTTIVGEGFMYPGVSPPEAAVESFGTTVRSLFSLFRMMNGDSDVAEAVFDIPLGQVMFVLFMIATNWAVLAILTSVVSDHMISTSQSYEKEEEEAHDKELERDQETKLRGIFEDYSKTHLTRDQWELILADESTLGAIEEVTSFSEYQLWDAFDELSGGPDPKHPVLRIAEFIRFVQAKNKPADLQYVMKLMARIKQLEMRTDKKPRPVPDGGNRRRSPPAKEFSTNSRPMSQGGATSSRENVSRENSPPRERLRARTPRDYTTPKPQAPSRPRPLRMLSAKNPPLRAL